MALDTSLSTQYNDIKTIAATAINKLSAIADATNYTTFGVQSKDKALNSYTPIYTHLDNLVDPVNDDFQNDATMADNGILQVVQTLALADYTATNLDAVTADFSAVPTAVDVSTFDQPVWSGTFFANLKTGLETYYGTLLGAANIDAVLTALTSDADKLSVAFYAKDRERKQQGLRDAFSAANAATGAKGFTIPNCMTTALRLAAQQNYQFDLSQVSRDLIQMLSAWAKTNYQFTVDKSLSAHNADVEFNSRYADTLLKSYETTLNGIIAQHRTTLEVAVQKVEAQVREYAIMLDAAIRQYAATTDVDIRVFAANEDTTLRRFLAQSEVAEKDAVTASDVRAKYYGILMDLAKTKTTVLSAEDQANLQAYAEKIREAVANNGTLIQAQTNQAVAKINAVAGAANAAASLANGVSQSIVGIQPI